MSWSPQQKTKQNKFDEMQTLLTQSGM